jgi:hypothetical protein
MIVIDHALWFDSCEGHSAVVLAFLYLIFGSIFGIANVVRRRSPKPEIKGSSVGMMIFSGIGLIALTLICLFWPFPPEIVRVSILGPHIELRRCYTWSHDRLVYPAADIEFRYRREEHGTKRMVHHMLVIERRGQSKPLGSVEFVPKYKFDFVALRQLAPAAVLEYERASAIKP